MKEKIIMKQGKRNWLVINLIAVSQIMAVLALNNKFVLFGAMMVSSFVSLFGICKGVF